jgi:multiple sugar transport system permease protein
LPFVIGFLVFQAYPFIYSLYLTFTKWDMFNAPQWVGLQNWKSIFHEKQMYYAFRNIFYFALIFVPLKTGIAFVAAYVLNQSIRFKGFFRVIFFLPVITPWIAAGMVWSWILNSHFGVVNLLLSYIHLGPYKYLDNPNWWVVIGSVAVANIWKGIGGSMVLLLAGMQNISKDLYEAADLDGASKWQVFRRIVVPLVSPMAYMVLILSTISAFHAFDSFLTLVGAPGGVRDQLLTVNIMIYRDAFILFKMGPASAMAWLLFIVILVITIFQRKMEKRWVHYD